jgi:hypothetical protein
MSGSSPNTSSITLTNPTLSYRAGGGRPGLEGLPPGRPSVGASVVVAHGTRPFPLATPLF